jgi:glycosyltransferase involved in cell wall biosynthesis
MWHLIFKDDLLLIVELNPRIISNWIFLFVRRALNKDIYVWGHAWGRKGVNSKTDFLRNFMRKLGNGVIVYTNKQKFELQLKMPQKKIFSAPNSLLSSSKMVLNEDHEIRQNIISVGRLVSAKKTLLLVKAFVKCLDKLPIETKLVIIGDGDEKERIKEFVNFNGLTERIQLLGHISDYDRLKDLYAEAYFSVSFGYIGLSVIQSFGFGVPMLVSENENHSPEIEATVLGKNTIFFKTGDEDDFIKKVQHVFENRKYWNNERKNIVEFCKKNYSTEAMAKVFIDLV